MLFTGDGKDNVSLCVTCMVSVSWSVTIYLQMALQIVMLFFIIILYKFMEDSYSSRVYRHSSVGDITLDINIVKVVGLKQ